jgi:putative transposase
MQYLNRHKQVGSHNHRKASFKIARLHQKIANIRKDTLHKITTYISKNHAVLGIEDLNVSRHLLQVGKPAQRSGLGMLANGKLSKAIADMGFYELCATRTLRERRQILSKKVVRNAPNGCSKCRHVNVKPSWFALNAMRKSNTDAT